MTADRRQNRRLGVGLGSIGAVAVAIQVVLVIATSAGNPVALAVGSVGALVWYAGALAGLRGTPRRLLAAFALLWIVGWIAIAPGATAGSQSELYAGTLAGGCLVCGITCGLVLARRPTGDSTIPWRAAGWGLLAGGAFVVPSGLGLFVGPESVALAFAILAGLTVILLFLFRPPE